MLLLCVVGVEHARDGRAVVARCVGVGRADGRGVGTRRCRGNALAAARGTVSHAIVPFVCRADHASPALWVSARASVPTPC
eukprot:2163388-Prymnesium_polylepis.1